MGKGLPRRWDRETILLAAEEFDGNIAAMARALDCPDASLRKHIGRDPGLLAEVVAFRPLAVRKTNDRRQMLADKPGLAVKGDRATITTDPAPDLGDIATLIKERGLSPDDWEVKRATLNEWDSNAGDGQVIKLRQLKIELVRRVVIDWPKPGPAPVRALKPRRPVKGKPFRWLAIPDPHCPYQDDKLLDRLAAVAKALDVEGVIFLGDTGDFADISKHRDNPAWSATAQESIDAATRMIATFRDTLPDARMVKLEGNHDWRLASELLLRAERLHGIRPGTFREEGNPPAALSLRRLLRLDDLGVELIEPELAGDDYDHAEFWLAPTLVAIHGKHTGTRTKSGAMSHAERMGASVVMGHTHRQNVMTVTRWQPPAGRRELVACELGTCRHITKSVGYADRPNWQAGAGLITVWPDDTHQVELARWNSKHLILRGTRW